MTILEVSEYFQSYSNMNFSEDYYNDYVDYTDYTTYPEYKAGDFIWKIFPPILLILGTTGNILAILVLRREKIRKSVCSTFLIVLSVSDLFVLYSGLLRQWIKTTFEVDIRDYGSGICKLHSLIVYFSLDLSSWILVAVTIERFGLVWFPQKTKVRCTKKFALVSLVATGVFLFLCNSHILYGMGDKEYFVNGTVFINKCSYVTPEYEKFFLESWPWIDLTIFCGIPFCFILIGNFLIFMKVFYSQRTIKRQIAPTNNGKTKNESKLSSMSIMLVTLNTMFLVCTTPISVYLVGYSSWSTAQVGRDLAVLEMMWPIVNILQYLNNSINFLLYILSGTRFRREFKDMFKRKGKQEMPQVHNESSTHLDIATAMNAQTEVNTTV